MEEVVSEEEITEEMYLKAKRRTMNRADWRKWFKQYEKNKKKQINKGIK